MTSSLKTAKRADHATLADALRRRVLEGTGETCSVLRQTVAASAIGGPPALPPRDELARQIGEAAYRTTDEQVANVLRATGTEKSARSLRQPGRRIVIRSTVPAPFKDGSRG